MSTLVDESLGNSRRLRRWEQDLRSEISMTAVADIGRRRVPCVGTVAPRSFSALCSHMV